MNDPTPIGKLVRERPVIRIPKVCLQPPRGCGKEYEGNSLTPLQPGEIRRSWPCDECIDRREAAEQAEKERRDIQDEPAAPPRRTKGEW